MKKGKVKRYADEGLVEDDDINRAVKAAQKPDVEKLKEGIAAGTPAAEEEGNRPGRNLALEKSASPKPRPRAAKPPPRASQSFPVDANMESASSVMSRGRASTDGSGSSPLEKYKQDKEARATRDKRKMDLAIERVKAGVGYKSGGSASSRADGCAVRGKTRGKMY
mgnify:CR=1 FL=1